MRMSHRLSGIAFAVAAAAVQASAQTNIVNQGPMAWQSGVVGQTWSTATVQPQITEVFHPGRVGPEHQNPLTYPAYVPNSLPVGAASTTVKRTKLGPKFRGISSTGWVPPDPNTAVGPSHLVQVVNSDIAFFNKLSGQRTFQTALGPINGSAEGFFESLGVFDFVFDPKCTYDIESGRFFVVALELDDASQTSKLLVAVSDDNDPNGTWHKYRFEAKLTISGNVTWMDYPSIAVNKDAFVCSGNQFGFSTGFGGVQLLVAPKAPMLTGAAASAASILVTNGFTLQPARTNDTAIDKIYCVSTAGQSSQMNVYALTNLTSANPTLNSVAVTTPAYVYPFETPPSAGGRLLDNLGNRMMTAAYGGGKLYFSHTASASTTDDRNVARWYEIATNDYPTGTPAFVQGGNVAGGSGQFHFQPAITVNSIGDVAMVFSRSSSGIVADVMATGRRPADPPGMMGVATLIEASLGSAYGGPGYNRWGDYFAIEVDPSDNTTFWATCMIADSNGSWLSTFYKLTIGDVLPGQSAIKLDALTKDIYTDANSNPNVQGGTLVGDLEAVHESDDDFIEVDSVAIERLGQVAAVEFSYQTDGLPSALKHLGARIEALAPSGVTGMIWMYDWVSNKFVQLKSYKMKSSGNAFVDGDVKKSRSRYIGPGGTIRVVFRALRPVRTGRGSSQAPQPFTLKVDMASGRVRF